MVKYVNNRRNEGNMSIRKRVLPSGQVRWLCDYADQQGVRRARQFKSKKQAEHFELTARVEIRDGVHVADRASVTVAEAGELWLTRCRSEGLEASTLAYYRQHLDLHISPQIGGVKLSKLTRPHIEAFRDKLLATKIKRPTAGKVLTSLRGLLFNAQRIGLVGQNVAVGTTVKIGERDRRKIEIPTKEELRRIITATGGVSSLWRAFIITAMFTGLRPSELRGLTWENVDLDAKLIRVRQRAYFKGVMGSPKSAAGNRYVPLAPMVLNILREWKLACPKLDSGLVFPAPRGGVPCHAETWRAWQAVLEAAGLPSKSYRAYDLRHVAASLLIEEGWQPKKLGAVMGHSSIQMTYDVYGHLWQTPEDDAAAMAKAEARLMGIRAIK
jgi:integrase